MLEEELDKMERPEYIYQKRKKHHLGLYVFLIFLLIIGYLFYTSFYNPELGKITANIIKNTAKSSNSIKIEAGLSSPEKISINGKIEKIELSADSGYFLVGKEKFELKKSSIVIENYNGELDFGKNSITRLKGKSNKIFFNGIPITGSPEIKISLENSDYNYLKLTNFYLSSLNYKASGIVRIDNEKVLIKLDNDDFKIEDFSGNLNIRGDKLEMNGEIKRSNLGHIDIRAKTDKTIVKNITN